MNPLTQRILAIFPTMIVLSVLIFVAMRIAAGGPLEAMYGTEQGLSPEVKEALESKYDLNKPVLLQYFQWLGHFFSGDWGTSISSGLPVINLVLSRFPWTLLLTIASLLIGLLIAFPLGIAAAAKPNSIFDHFALGASLFGQAIPGFLLGIILIFLFSLKLNLLPSFGAANPFVSPLSAIKHLILPALTLGIGGASVVIRILRSCIREELVKPYIITARSKGLSTQQVLLKHALKNALIPTVTVIGIWIALAMSGSIVIESIFAWPGIGQLLYQSVLNRDYPIVQTIVMFVTVIILFVNLAVDGIYRFLDPRIKRSL